MIRHLCAVALLLPAAVLTACSAAAANPLIGDWRVEPGGDVSSDGFQYCKVIPEFTFTQTTKTTYLDGGKQSTEPIIYLVSGKNVFVSSTPGFVDAPEFTMLGPDEMMWDAVGHCKYRRS